ncbi:hypothetical protein B0F89_11372 [Malaciobacter marinus]|uniref:Uncharacterized protein n=1 Tax=Malaciobacter marinus TaxID=505249 RepID=A0AB36ZVW5_9BACT|nr:hypothetical protein [Malaciobacter marinus]PPK61076.1 hypothetical protein B0F89_11372 [Malaciobacter marinus]
MEKFEKILSLFIKNPYSNIELSDSFKANFKNRFFTIFYILPINIIIISLMGYFQVSEKINDSINDFNQFSFLMYFYKYLCFIIPIFYIVLIKNYFHIKYKLLGFRNSMFYFTISFFVLLTFFPFSGLFIIENIKATTIFIYYITAVIFYIYYYYYYYYKWKKNIFVENYDKYKKEVFKINFPLDSLVGKFSLDLKEGEKEKPIFTKISEWIATIMLRFGLTIPVLAAIFGSGSIKSYDVAIYFGIYMFLFLIPIFSKVITGGVVFRKFLKQIEKEENVTIYNGKFKL